MILGLIAMSFCLFVAIFGLLVFHCYLGCVLHNTTLSYLYQDVDRPKKNPAMVSNDKAYTERVLI